MTSYTQTVIQVFPSKMAYALQGFDDMGQPLYKNAERRNATGSLFSLSDVLNEDFDTDAHVCGYRVDYGDSEERIHYDRVSKNGLGAIRARGGEVWCSTIFIDIDLCDIVSAKGKVSWSSLEAKKAQELWSLLRSPVPGLPPAAAVYKTTNGVRIVHPLLEDVPAGAKFEAVISAVHKRYLVAKISIDLACKDWTRMYRLPKVNREGVHTADQDWFEMVISDDPSETFLMVEELGLDLDSVEDTNYVIDVARQRDITAPSDEEAYTLLYTDEGKPTDILKEARQTFRVHSMGAYLVCQGNSLPEGSRNTNVVKMAGALSRSHFTLEASYAIIMETIKLMDQDEDWRAIAWTKLVEFFAVDEAKKEAEKRVVPERLQNVQSPEPEAEGIVRLRDIPVGRTVDDWVEQARQPQAELVRSQSSNSVEIKSIPNLATLLSMLNIHVQFDQFAQTVRVTHEDPSMCGPLTDFTERKIRRMVAEMGYDSTHKDFTSFLQTIAEGDQGHPVIEFLTECHEAWDGVPRVENWMSTYVGVEESEYARCVGAVTLVGCVRRVFQPGCKHDTMMILEGPQGINKSQLLQAMAVNKDWFLDDLSLRSSSKEVIEQTAGKWLIECSELVGMHSNGWNDLKSLLSRQTDKGRAAYARHTSTVCRQFVLFGTTNESNYLGDSTGNRRFWPVKSGDADDIQLTKLRRDIKQLWGEAVNMWRREEYIVMPEDVYELATEEQETRLNIFGSAEMSVFETALDKPDGCFLKANLFKILDCSKQQVYKDVIATLDSLGWRQDGRYFVKGHGELKIYEPYEDHKYFKLILTKKTEFFEAPINEWFELDLNGFTNAQIDSHQFKSILTRRKSETARKTLRTAGWKFSSRTKLWTIGRSDRKVQLIFDASTNTAKLEEI